MTKRERGIIDEKVCDVLREKVGALRPLAASVFATSQYHSPWTYPGGIQEKVDTRPSRDLEMDKMPKKKKAQFGQAE